MIYDIEEEIKKLSTKKNNVGEKIIYLTKKIEICEEKHKKIKQLEHENRIYNTYIKTKKYDI